MTFTRRLAADEVALDVELSADLQTWSASAPLLLSRQEPQAGVESLTLRFLPPSPTAPPARYLRLHARRL